MVCLKFHCHDFCYLVTSDKRKLCERHQEEKEFGIWHVRTLPSFDNKILETATLKERAFEVMLPKTS